MGEVVGKGGREGGRPTTWVGIGKKGQEGKVGGSDGGQVVDQSVGGPDGEEWVE